MNEISPRQLSIVTGFRERSLRLSLQITIISSLILLSLLGFAYQYHLSSRTEQTLKSFQISLSQSVSVGDRFQLTRQLASMVESGSFAAIWLFDSRTKELLAEYEKNDLEFFSPSFPEMLGYFLQFDNFRPYLIARKRISSGSGTEEAARIYALVRFPLKEFVWILISILGMFFLIWFLVRRTFTATADELAKPIVDFSKSLERIQSRALTAQLKDEDFKYLEVQVAYQKFIALWNQNILRQEMEKELVKQAAIAETAQQVAHDIRSPLSALKIIVKSVENLPKDIKEILKSSTHRISEILDDLSLKTKAKEVLQETEIVNLYSVVDPIFLEKQTTLPAYVTLEFSHSDAAQARSSFVSINVRETGRVISNLINNAVEAASEVSGFVRIRIEKVENQNVIIFIEDNGRGIPDEILSVLGSRGATLGKKDGSGLGLYHARKTFGDRLKINTKIGVGTIVSINFEIVEAG